MTGEGMFDDEDGGRDGTGEDVTHSEADRDLEAAIKAEDAKKSKGGRKKSAATAQDLTPAEMLAAELGSDWGDMALEVGATPSPMRLGVMGVAGVGKTSFAAGAEAAVIMQIERGAANVDAVKLPTPKDLNSLYAQVRKLHQKAHPFRQVVVDTIDAVIELMANHVKDREGVEHLDDVGGGFGKGKAAVREEMLRFLRTLETLQEDRGMDIIVLAHTRIVRMNNPLGADYDRYELSLPNDARSDVAADVRNWLDHLLFARYEDAVDVVKGQAKGTSSGARILLTERHAAYDAKNRADLPAALPLEWGAFREALTAKRPNDPERLRGKIEAVLEEMSQEMAIETFEPIEQRIRKGVNGCGDDAVRLARAHAYAQGLLVQERISS